MSETPQSNPENTSNPDIKKYQEETQALFEMIDRMSSFVAPAANPEPGIQKWFKMDVPGDPNFTATDCNDNEISARVFEAKLHEQDSAHEVWEFKFSNNMQGEDERHVRGLAVKSKTGFDFLLSPTGSGNEEIATNTFRQASARQVSGYYDETLYHLDSEVRIIAAGYDNIGYDSPDSPGQKEDWDGMLQLWAEDGTTIPGLMENGQLIKK